MTHEETEIVRQQLCFEERDHVHPDDTRRGKYREATLVLQKRDHLLADGTRRGRNREAALVLQRTRPRTS
jgi:hypothetical protein